jgi:predicted nucleic acid-binding protein
MPKTIILDSGSLGMVTNPRAKSEDSQACKRWFEGVLRARDRIVIPEIADYEVRRELVRGQNFNSLNQLDRLKRSVVYLPITTEMMIQAAQLWAVARQTGQPTAHPHALDGDVILAAQVVVAYGEDLDAIVATTNVAHISRFVRADLWQNIG